MRVESQRLLTRSVVLLIGLFLGAAAAEAASCSPSPTRLCLSGQRFAVEAHWRDFQGNSGEGKSVALTSDTGYFWFFSDSNVELVVKVLDARGVNNRFWVFFGALSNVEYTLKVTDTATGASKEYRNPPGRFASVGDTAAFPAATTGPATSETVTVAGKQSSPGSLAAIQRFIEAETARAEPTPAEPGAAKSLTSCPGPSTSLFLSGCRFQLDVQWTANGHVGSGQAVQLSGDTGYFWFFTDTNVELIVKVLDARGLGGGFWVFYGALSNVDYSLHVTDTVSGAVRVYRNPTGTFASAGDTSAFRGGYGVSVTPDAALATSGLISAASGGTLVAAAADGAVFTLEVPPHALTSDRTLTMTPVSAVGGLPFAGGLAAAVDIEPSGLYLSHAARLTIHTPSPVTRAEETAVAWNGSGEDFFLYPPAAAAGDLQLYLAHLGGYGVARGTDAERASQAGREPMGDDDWLSHRSAPILRQGRSATASVMEPMAGGGSDWRAQERQLCDQVYTTLRDKMQGTLGDPNQVVNLVKELESWEATVENYLGPLEGVFPGRAAEIRRVLQSMLQRSLRLIHARCVEDVTAINQLPKIIAVATNHGLDLAADIAEATKCLSFTLSFDSSLISALEAKGVKAAMTHGATITPAQIRFQPGKLIASFTTTSRATAASFSGLPKECSFTTSLGGSSTFAGNLGLGGDLEKFNGPLSVLLAYEPGVPPSILTLKCEDDPDAPIPNFWNGVYEVLHADEHESDLSGGGLYFADAWRPIGMKDPWALRQYIRAKPTTGGTLHETTTLKLAHTPQ